MTDQKTSGTGGVPSGNAQGRNQQGSAAGLDELKTRVDELSQTLQDAQAKLAESEGARERDVSKVRSDLMRAHAQRQKEWEERDKHYQQQLHDLAVKDMDDASKSKYEADFYRGRVLEMEKELSEVRQQMGETTQMLGFTKALQEGFGIGMKDLNVESPENLMESGWQAVTNSYQQLRQELDELRTKGTTPPPPTPRDAPPVVTDVGGQTGGPSTLTDIVQSVGKQLGREISEEELFMLAERPHESGVDLNQLLPAIQAEIDKLQS